MQREDFSLYTICIAVIFADDWRFKRTIPISKNLDVDLAQPGLDCLLGIAGSLFDAWDR